MRVVAVNTAPWNSLDQWRAYWRSKGAADVTWTSDSEQGLVRRFNVRTLGTTIIIDREGHVTYRDDGATPYSTLRAQVEEAL